MATTGERFERAVRIMERLRAPGGCPWDREQTFDSIKPYTLEETYEVLEAIDNRDWPELTGELGDLLLQVLFYSEMAREAGHFAIDDVLDRLSDKLVGPASACVWRCEGRHSGGSSAQLGSAEGRREEGCGGKETGAAGEANGEGKSLDVGGKSAARDVEETPPSVLAGVSSKVPALLEAHKLSERAARVGFDWPEMEGLFDKLAEETAELREELKALPVKGSPGKGVAGSGKPRYRPRRGSGWKMKSAIFSLCW